MPTRYLKPGIRDSERINALSAEAEVLYYRLIVTVDDFGRTDARPAMIKSACFPVRERATAKMCQAWLEELAAAGLVTLYACDGKPYMQVCRWDNQPRARASKFPAPSQQARTDADGCIQVHASAQQVHASAQQVHASAQQARTDADGCIQVHASVEQVHTDADGPRTLVPVTGTGTGTGTGNREPDAERAASASPPTRGSRLPVGWNPEPVHMAFAESLGLANGMALAELEKFRDYWSAQPGQKGVKTDWPATWRNWVRRAVEQRPLAAKSGGDVFAGAL